MEAAIWGFVGTLVGALVSLLTTRFNNEHSAELKRIERAAVREQEARAFQRETLLRLQEELEPFTQFAFGVLLRGAGPAVAGIPKEEATAARSEFFAHTAKLRVLLERVADDDLRVAIRAMLHTATSSVSTQDSWKALADHDDVIDQQIEIMQAIGRLLRSHY